MDTTLGHQMNELGGFGLRSRTVNSYRITNDRLIVRINGDWKIFWGLAIRMNASKLPRKIGSKSEPSNSDDSMASQNSSPTNADNKTEDAGDDQNSQDDTKSEDGNANGALESGMSLRDRRKRKVINYRYSPDITPAPAPAVERKASAKSSDKASNAKNELSNWLQCDLCQKWRLVNPVLFESLKKLDHFNCRSLQGVTCKDKDDWVAGNESMTGSDGGSIRDDFYASRRMGPGNAVNRRLPPSKRVNIFAGKYIPGFGAEFSDND